MNGSPRTKISDCFTGMLKLVKAIVCYVLGKERVGSFKLPFVVI